MKRLFLPALAMIEAAGLTACAQMPARPPTASLYEAVSGYSAALKGAVAYAESPTADKAIVRKLAAVNRAEGVQATVKFARAYVACRGSSAAVVPDFDCAAWSFTPAKVSSTAIALRNLTAALTVKE